MYLHGTSKINSKGHLEVGGIDLVDLADKYGTPLYIYDEALIRQQIRDFREAFEASGLSYQVAYASKAFSSMAIYKLVESEGMSLDVVSAGELHTAVMADFPRDRIHFHGNNKSRAELGYGLDQGIGCFVVDNFYEIDLLDQLARERGQVAKILIRVTPGVTASTHEAIQTGQADSKFGFDLANGQALEAVHAIKGKGNIKLIGLHAHIGSQIFETRGFALAAEKMMDFFVLVKKNYIEDLSVLNLGGGFGVRYTEADQPLAIRDYVNNLAAIVKNEAQKHKIEPPKIWIEPGRSIVAEAGMTLYTLGSTKDIPGVRKYVAVDGGMSDNIRPALYDAKYEAMIVNKAGQRADDLVTVAGKCCESGDMLIRDIKLASPEPGDILAVSVTGAYGYAMANNYNRIPRPVVVFVYQGQADLVIERESLDDIVRNDRLPDRLRGL